MDTLSENVTENNKTGGWIFFVRQVFPCSVTVLHFFVYGVYQGAPTVIIPQLRKEANSTDVVSPEMASWLSSISAYGAIPWAIILPILGYRYGRKILMVLVSLISLLGNIFFYYSTSAKDLLISQAIQGISLASMMTVTVMVTSEYTSPKYRGIILAFNCATFFWGIWVSNAIGTFFHWRNITIVVFVCCIYNLSSVFCCESPVWLATKGRFDECAKIHRWLKGTGEDSEAELRRLISSQKDHLNNKANVNSQKKGRIIKMWNILVQKSFHKPLAYAFLAECLYNFSGKIACTLYAIDIIKKITASEETAYETMLILDGVTVLSMYIGCMLAKVLKRRKQLLSFSSTGVCFLYVLSIYLYMINLNIISENNYVSLLLLTGFSISISCGPMILSTCCLAELAPLRYRSYFLTCFSLLCYTLYGTILKITPSIFKLCGTYGAFLFYGVSSNIIIILLYKYLPETKDKTIQEIQNIIISGEDHYADVNIANSEVVPLEEPQTTETTH